jgi:hypothetical protein
MNSNASDFLKSIQDPSPRYEVVKEGAHLAPIMPSGDHEEVVEEMLGIIREASELGQSLKNVEILQ